MTAGTELALQPGPLPALAARHVTFGCLNNFCKVHNHALALWARVLRSVAGSRLILLAPRDARQRTLEFLGSNGIEPWRIEFVNSGAIGQYLCHYRRIDIGLDTFPYNGHTTSLDALWMGVPVVTLVGKTVVGRAGLSQLTNLNLTHLIATTEERYVEVAAGLAADRPRLTELRAGMRQRMRESPLTDAPRFARNIESAYRAMWRRWCDDDSTRRNRD
jgi:predicted O-linked N-acetylglucosamine transferase (SPINDLY family)